MELISQRFRSLGLSILSHFKINGAHAGNIYRVKTEVEGNSENSFIYKEYASDRTNELKVMEMLAPIIGSYTPKIYSTFDRNPPAIIQSDAGIPLKKVMSDYSLMDQVEILNKILETLSEFHINALTLSQKISKESHLVSHAPSKEWGEWAIKNLSQLKGFDINELMTIEFIANKFYSMTTNYKPKVATITHGDPHLDNVFLTGEQIKFIDWEWAGFTSPIRDVSFILQDIYNLDLLRYVVTRYHELISETVLQVSEAEYMRDLAIWGIDTTLMMIGWEIEKFLLGEEIGADILNKVKFKIQFVQEQWNYFEKM
ncbi:phosphotransferase [Brevibacillus porteri]|uniref:Aminoglycoside phosphotransferase domain-containing protein n=1 Tax=Brevibacillus porteri TaxID=2126350 RepID=A0ABX5FM41_9BACL|nr:phosphotransferase [Brevibacillus porteri]MED1800670.1 phosphotransferase [Brevibacillus porteri]MED2133172.1 phosphotransferase [Brevibacillus porteri]MED2746074.1 phosphotransferase [Brevibacillus porteri]MED2817351.1 phosphotransferase [Brevibacillus porteri]MED2896160.1 phosphotransferase [Brevibacillus porteri]